MGQLIVARVQLALRRGAGGDFARDNLISKIEGDIVQLSLLEDVAAGEIKRYLERSCYLGKR